MPDGVYLDMPHGLYIADFAIGSSGLKTLRASPPEWWWDSPFNTVGKDEEGDAEKDAFRIGTAVHAAFLEGWDVYKARFGFRPDKKSNPKALDTIQQLKSELKELHQLLKDHGLEDQAVKPAGPNKGDLIKAILEMHPGAEILEVVQAAWDKLKKTKVSPVEDAKIQRLHAMMMRSAQELKLPDGTMDLREAFTGAGLSEVSVFWTDDWSGVPVRQRCRMDRLMPNSTIDLKTFSSWRSSNFDVALLRECAIRGYVHQAAHYDVGRERLRDLVAAGKVWQYRKVGETDDGVPIYELGDPDSEKLELLQEIAASEVWAWIWVFGKTKGAPQVQGIVHNRNFQVHQRAMQDRLEALAKFVHYYEFFGLKTDAMWVDPIMVWTPNETDWPPWAALPE